MTTQCLDSERPRPQTEIRSGAETRTGNRSLRSGRPCRHDEREAAVHFQAATGVYADFPPFVRRSSKPCTIVPWCARHFGSWSVQTRRMARLLNDESPVPTLEVEESIDLHGFRPRDVPHVVESYLEAAREKGLTEVRLIHGRGIGVQRARVHSLLRRLPYVVEFVSAPGYLGGWGATVVRIAPNRGP